MFMVAELDQSERRREQWSGEGGRKRERGMRGCIYRDQKLHLRLINSLGGMRRVRSRTSGGVNKNILSVGPLLEGGKDVMEAAAPPPHNLSRHLSTQVAPPIGREAKYSVAPAAGAKSVCININSLTTSEQYLRYLPPSPFEIHRQLIRNHHKAPSCSPGI